MQKNGGPQASELPTENALARAVAGFARTDGDHATSIPGLTLHRRNAITQPLHCIYGLGLGVVLQGAKQVTLREQVVGYQQGQSMLTTIDLPVLARVTQASMRDPFLGLMLTLDVRSLMQIASEMELPLPEKTCSCQPVTIEKLDTALADALIRLVNLLDEPALVSKLAPLIQQEITIRLLTGSHGPQLRHLVTAGAPGQKIAKAVSWLKQHFTEPLHVDELAERSRMSPSTFRQHFRSITGMSPLQFQKQLRLQEARQLMLNQNLDASHAGGLVGYESASQFNREYSRLFGAPPQRDVKRMRMN
ncbi:AraC family transcriptional regulator [Hydrogenophaga palleronii]|uniref:AraC family transcriptional regulator n=1 Tax=Hydrogenophaga palleronii TaxID=65655 RepID=UPI000826B217|nr:AraC family transcriptional regulator [Hydrogenophaga palleronii]